MQRIAIIGGTGMTGECAVAHAIEKGLKVRLLYRTEATVPESFKGKVELVQGDATKYEDVKRLIEGVEGVCVVLGTRNKLEATTELSRGTENLIKAMKEAKLTKFSIVMSSFLLRPLNQVPAVFHRLNEEHQRMLDLTKASGLDYIAILPPHIADEPSTAYSVVHDDAPARLVSKYDLGKFIVDSLDQPEHYGKVCGIGKAAKTT